MTDTKQKILLSMIPKKYRDIFAEWLTQKRQEDMWGSFIDREDEMRVRFLQRFVDELLKEVRQQ